MNHRDKYLKWSLKFNKFDTYQRFHSFLSFAPTLYNYNTEKYISIKKTLCFCWIQRVDRQYVNDKYSLKLL